MPVLTDDQAHAMNEYWSAANYLSVGQIYLKDNPLLERPITPDDIKPRLLGHFGTTPGLNFVYVHLNRIIREQQANVMYLIGPGHGAPGILANTYLEGSYTEIYPNIERDRDGIKAFFRQFSWPYGIPSHDAPNVPGSINEGGELGYSLVHAYGAAFDNPDLLVACVVGDGEAETGTLATSWHSNKFLNPITDGAVLPILHLNGFKIANPTVLARITHDELESLFKGYGYKPYFLEGDDPTHHAQGHGRGDGRDGRGDSHDPEAGARQQRCDEAHMAHACAAHAKGLDRAEVCRRQAGGRYVASAPGSAGSSKDEPGAPAAAERLDALLQAGRGVR